MPETFILLIKQRFLTRNSVSENFVLTPDRGSVAFLATTSLGIVQYLDIFNTSNYRAISFTKYGQTIGEIMQEAIRRSFDVTTQFDFYARVHCEQISLNGDPALKYNTQPKPDYVIEDPLVKVSPSFISVDETSFQIDARMLNMGKVVDSNIVIEIKRTYPNGITQVIQRDTVPGIRYTDSISLKIPIIANRDVGLNRITITVDADNSVDELYETNNTITKDVFIYNDAAKPIYPYNFSIVNKQNIELVASTANPFAVSSKYNVEIDTTEFFNSPLKVSGTVTTTGGVIEFIPGITFTDSTVYYWRVAQIPAQGEPKWSTFSFIYLMNSEPGFNQSHFFQHLKSTSQGVELDSNSRSWKYGTSTQNLFIRNGSWVTSAGQEANFSITDGNHSNIHNTCWFQSVVFNVYDPKTFKPWLNATLDHVAPIGHGLYGSGATDCSSGRQNNFEYRWDSATSRKRAMDFMQNVIPDGSYVIVRSFLLDPVIYPQYANLIRYAPAWHNDQGHLWSRAKFRSIFEGCRLCRHRFVLSAP